VVPYANWFFFFCTALAKFCPLIGHNPLKNLLTCKNNTSKIIDVAFYHVILLQMYKSMASIPTKTKVKLLTNVQRELLHVLKFL
jgi:hypothetical protein